jgi:hypothetical protein
METIDLRSNIHKIVDGIQSEQSLQKLYNFLKVWDTNKPGQLWDSLTEKQKQEVLLAYGESENEDDLIARENVFKQTK